MSNQTMIDKFFNLLFNVITLFIPYAIYTAKRKNLDFSDIMSFICGGLLLCLLGGAISGLVFLAIHGSYSQYKIQDVEWEYQNLGVIEEIYIVDSDSNQGTIKTTTHYLTDVDFDYIESFKKNGKIWIQHREYGSAYDNKLCVEGADKCYDYPKIDKVKIPDFIGTQMEELTMEKIDGRNKQQGNAG